jgi:glycosyltransferase involved in cell wall biosynthesis
VLLVHSQYSSGSISGENRVVDDQLALLRDAGHDVEAYQPDTVGESAFAMGMRAVWSARARADITSIIRTFHPDVVHFHNLFPNISPAALRIVGKPAVVLTLHNYRLMCLPATLLRNGAICENCVGRLPWSGVVHRCYRGSTAGSMVLATSLGAHRKLRSFRHVNRFLAVSEFVKRKHIESGIEPSKIEVSPQFCWPREVRRGAGTYFLYAGRLSPEKGISHLAADWRQSWGQLRIVGGGPQEDQIRSQAAASAGSIVFAGEASPSGVEREIQSARAVLVPSLSYEGAPRIVIEAFAAGVPVVASAIGGLTEMVATGTTGYSVPVGSSDAWTEALSLMNDDATNVAMGSAGYQQWIARHSPSIAAERLESAYALAGQC